MKHEFTDRELCLLYHFTLNAQHHIKGDGFMIEAIHLTRKLVTVMAHQIKDLSVVTKAEQDFKKHYKP